MVNLNLRRVTVLFARSLARDAKDVLSPPASLTAPTFSSILLPFTLLYPLPPFPPLSSSHPFTRPPSLFSPLLPSSLLSTPLLSSPPFQSSSLLSLPLSSPFVSPPLSPPPLLSSLFLCSHASCSYGGLSRDTVNFSRPWPCYPGDSPGE